MVKNEKEKTKNRLITPCIKYTEIVNNRFKKKHNNFLGSQGYNKIRKKW